MSARMSAASWLSVPLETATLREPPSTESVLRHLQNIAFDTGNLDAPNMYLQALLKGKTYGTQEHTEALTKAKIFVRLMSNKYPVLEATLLSTVMQFGFHVQFTTQ